MRPGLALDKKGNNHVQASEQAIDAKYSNFLLIPSMMHCGRQLADLYDSLLDWRRQKIGHRIGGWSR